MRAGVRRKPITAEHARETTNSSSNKNLFKNSGESLQMLQKATFFSEIWLLQLTVELRNVCAH